MIGDGETRVSDAKAPRRRAAAAAMALLLIVAALGGGCAESAIAAAGATAGFGLAQGQAESFIRGELKAARLVPLEHAQEATVAALDEMAVPVATHRVRARDAYIRGRADGGREIKIGFKSDSPLITRFSIRVGLMGDQAVSRLVMARIDKALGLTEPHAVPGIFENGFDAQYDGEYE